MSTLRFSHWAVIAIPTKKKKSTQPRAATAYKECVSCPPGRQKQRIDNFYISYNSLHADGRVPICKDCIVRMCYNDDIDDVDLEKLKAVLRQIDKPFIESVWESSIDQYNKVYENQPVEHGKRKLLISHYFKNVNSLLFIYYNIGWNSQNST